MAKHKLSVNPRITLTEGGHVEAYAWPGGYPLYYLTEDGSVLSPDAVEENLELCNDPDDPQWYVVGVAVNWEDQELFCDHTGLKIECAYPQD